MSASYKGFWIIAGMTFGAVVIAHSTAKPGRSTSTSQIEYSDAGTSRSVFPSTTTMPSPPTPTLPGPSSSTSASLSQASPSAATAETSNQTAVTGNTETRSIDPDFQAAFDRAIEVALTIPATTSSPISVAEPTPDQTPAPLETKEIATPPKIFDEPATANIGDEGEQSGSADRVVTTTNLNLREGPDPAYLKVQTLANGSELQVLERQGKWMRVRSMSSKAEGWINGTFVRSKL